VCIAILWITGGTSPLNPIEMLFHTVQLLQDKTGKHAQTLRKLQMCLSSLWALITPSQFSIPDNAVFDTRNKSSLKLLSSPIASCVPVY
jgi:hypothetical protein